MNKIKRMKKEKYPARPAYLENFILNMTNIKQDEQDKKEEKRKHPAHPVYLENFILNMTNIKQDEQDKKDEKREISCSSCLSC